MMKKFKITFLIIFLVTFFSSAPKANALDYIYTRKFAGVDAGNSFSIAANGKLTGEYYYGVDADATSDYILVSFCTQGTNYSSWVNGGNLAEDGILIDTNSWCSAGGADGTLKLIYYFVENWNYSSSGSEAYIEGSSSTIYNRNSYTTKGRLMSITGASSLDMSIAILAYLQSQNGDIDYTSALNQIKQNQETYKEEIGIVQDKLDETNTNLEDIENAFTSESEDFEDKSCGVICKLGKIPGKIIDGLIDRLKSLFIPEDGYFDQWFNDLKTFFEEKLGFLATPFTIFIDFVNRFLNINVSSDIIINIPDITVPNFEDYKIISATTFNWSELLKSKDSLNVLWQLYLSFIDVIFITKFINLCQNKYNQIFGGDVTNDN